jgi:Flp pilus assembly protein TadG
MRLIVMLLDRVPGHRTGRRGTRGQVVVIFAGAMLLFTLLSAIVIDLSWYWSSNLKMQRAADAASLAGVIYLPGDVSGAYLTARNEAAKNGYSSATGYTVTPLQDPGNPRRLKVTISGRINTFFARVAGIDSFPARRVSKSDFVLPVPMGSPQNYYGVGFYEKIVTTTNTGATSWFDPSSVPGGNWTNPSNAYVPQLTGTVNASTRNSTTNPYGLWGGFNATLPTGTLTVTGIEVDVRANSSDNSGCTLRAALNWNGTSSVTSGSMTTATESVNLTGTYQYLTFGSPSDLWGRTWTATELNNSNLRVRLQYYDTTTACADGAVTNVDHIRVRIFWSQTTTAKQTASVNDPVSGTALASQGFWGAMFTPGGVRENGDRHGPANLGSGAVDAPGPANPNYDSEGYDYTLELPGGGGQVRLFDPIFCATGDNGHGGWLGAGDHWTSIQGGATNVRPVGVSYRLYDTQGTLANTSDDGSPIATLTYDPGNQTLADLGGTYGTPQAAQGGQPAHTDCSGDPGHNHWVTLDNGLAGGLYRLNVNTSLDASNSSVGAENLFSIWVGSGGNARVYGSGRMAAYSNLDGGLQKFYFAQIEKAHAGKTMQIDLFDPGETNGNAFLRLLSPDGNAYHYVTFDWKSDDGRSGTNVNVIQTSNGSALFNNKMITIKVPLPSTYGAGGLDPPGDITAEDGWWLIEYDIAQANDTTTWGVSIRGNPVHLVLP